MKNLLLLLLAAPAVALSAPAWLTVTGDQTDASLDTIQVDPASISAGDDTKTMRVRVSRAAPRVSWDKVSYRSYEAQVMFDCAKRSARYVSIAFYRQALWQGEAYARSDYTTGPVRQMLFLDVTPNPSARIVWAACMGPSAVPISDKN